MKKRVLSVLLVLSMTATLIVGCGNSENDSSAGSDQPEESGNEDTVNTESAADGDVYEMVMEIINFGYDDPDLVKVQDAVNEITVPEIGVKVKFLTVPIMEMSTKLGLLVAGNEKVDLAVTGLLTTPGKLVSDGLLLPMVSSWVLQVELL